ncbi:MAG: hypothetical protein HS116_18585 [Planctomycetes bacterium]|nr:hypothetical protein [Planctomycetota bacterium]
MTNKQSLASVWITMVAIGVVTQYAWAADTSPPDSVNPESCRDACWSMNHSDTSLKPALASSKHLEARRHASEFCPQAKEVGRCRFEACTACQAIERQERIVQTQTACLSACRGKRSARAITKPVEAKLARDRYEKAVKELCEQQGACQLECNDCVAALKAEQERAKTIRADMWRLDKPAAKGNLTPRQAR